MCLLLTDFIDFYHPLHLSLSLSLSPSLALLSAGQYHINKLSIMSSDNHMNNSEKEVDEVDAALSDLEITLEGGKTSNTLVATHTRTHLRLQNRPTPPHSILTLKE